MSDDATITIPYGNSSVSIQLSLDRVIQAKRAVEPVAAENPAEQYRLAVEAPTRFPALHFALTPDDHVAIIIDRWTGQDAAIAAVVTQLHLGQVRDENITIVGPESEDALPDFHGLKKEFHHPVDPQQRCYLGTTTSGRRVYLNRIVVEADQVVVVSDTHYDVDTGTSGGPLMIFPQLADEESSAGWRKLAPADLRVQAEEIAWLLGTPFFVHTVPGPGNTVGQVIGGGPDTYVDARKALQASWKLIVDRKAATVIATIGTDPARITTIEIVSAVLRAARVVEPDGSIIICFEGNPPIPKSLAAIGEFDGPDAARRALSRSANEHTEPIRWLKAVTTARVLVLGGWSEESVEELFATAIPQPKQIQRVIDRGGDVLILNDAQRVRVVVEPGDR